MKAAVIDASIAIKWVVAEPFSDRANMLLAHTTLCAPAHWQSEAVNALWGLVYRREISAEDAKDRASSLIDAPVAAVPLSGLLDRSLELSIEMRITVYDSLYVALAEARGLPLISSDRELMRRMAARPGLSRLAQPIEHLLLP